VKRLREVGKSIWDTLTFVACLALGIGIAVATFVWYLIPKWKKEEASATARRFENIKAAVKEAKESRAAETAVKVAEVEKKADEQKKADTVDLANQFIIDELKK